MCGQVQKLENFSV